MGDNEWFTCSKEIYPCLIFTLRAKDYMCMPSAGIRKSQTLSLVKSDHFSSFFFPPTSSPNLGALPPLSTSTCVLSLYLLITV